MMTPASRLCSVPSADQFWLLTRTAAPSTTMPLLCTFFWILTLLTTSRPMVRSCSR